MHIGKRGIEMHVYDLTQNPKAVASRPSIPTTSSSGTITGSIRRMQGSRNGRCGRIKAAAHSQALMH